MKRLLCVLMVMVMAVLMVPTIAGAEEIIIPSVSPKDGGTVSGEVYLDRGMIHVDLNVTKENSGYKFERWELDLFAERVSGGDPIYDIWNTPQLNVSIGSYTEEAYTSLSGTVTAYFVKEAEPDPEPAPEPEPIVVVEEKKPEEPHVHAEEWVPGTPATCTSTGLTDGSKCKWCGEVLQAQKEIPKIDHVYSMWVPNGSGKHYASCLYCGNKIDAACEKVQLPIKSTSGAAITLCPVCGDCNGATATAVKGLKVGEGAPYRGTLRVWNIDAGDNNKYLAVSFDRFGKVMQPEGEVSVTLPDDMKGTTAGVIGADGSVKTVQESNGTLKLDFTGSQVVVLKGN